MLRYGIPEYRLPYDQLDKDIAHILSAGVELKTGTRVGQDIVFGDMLGVYDACFISPGLSVPSDIGIEGEDNSRVVSGLDILRKVTDGVDPEVGKRVAVVGGGNVAMDAARTCRRLGAEVTVFYRRREVDMPADAEEIREAKEEGVVFVCQSIPLRVEAGRWRKKSCRKRQSRLRLGHREHGRPGTGEDVLRRNSSRVTNTLKPWTPSFPRSAREATFVPAVDRGMRHSARTRKDRRGRRRADRQPEGFRRRRHCEQEEGCRQRHRRRPPCGHCHRQVPERIRRLSGYDGLALSATNHLT